MNEKDLQIQNNHHFDGGHPSRGQVQTANSSQSVQALVQEEEVAPEHGVFGDGGYVTTKVGRELAGGRVGTFDDYHVVFTKNDEQHDTGKPGEVIEMDVDNTVAGDGAGGERSSCLFVIGGESWMKVEMKKRVNETYCGEGGDGGGGSVKMMTEMAGSDLFVQKLCYSLKYDQQMSMAVEGGGNEEHGYSYVSWNDGLRRRAQRTSATSEGRMHTCGHGVVYTITKRNDDAAMALVTERGGCVSGHLQSRLRLGGEINKLSNDDEISMVSNDVGDEETIAKECDEGSKGGGYDEENNKNDSLKNALGERIEQKLSKTSKKIGCIATIEYYSLMLREYNVELNISATQQLIYNQLVHPMKTHDMGKVNDETGRMVGGEELDDEYLAPNNG
ncbi:hypothetical protein Cgig2_000322 [Carnegiea gigantea]|uniref:Uncharacterized protein n=1 Tax=Carnegiea gigantea TaxID=171969 RepID=A0A9Q1JFF9_9CARY|nr:hypothetical protein Cgig2_000322 [Carnegiea gigantea]